MTVARGPSPRVRGNPETPPAGDGARVHPRVCGETAVDVDQHTIPAGVHPRVCGETEAILGLGHRHPGPSPRVRGNLFDDRQPLVDAGSIPACAGKPRSESCPGRRRRVHPRVCGETCRFRLRQSLGWGPSPRVRGNPDAADPILDLVGSIPACAGKPTRQTGGACISGVHPRVCGETVLLQRLMGQALGPSPRVRGNQGPDVYG